MDQSPKADREEDNEYFKLVRAVGTEGKYQTFLVLFAILVCIQNGIISLGTSYYFAVPSYTECPSPHQGISKCTKYACSLPLSQRAQYEHKQIKLLTTMGTEFGNYQCQNRDSVEKAKGTYFLGAVLGFIVVGLMADNIGRRLSLIFCLGVGLVGYMVMLLASSLTMAGIGNFFVGFSIESSFNLVFCLLSEMLQNDRRQKMQTFIQAWLPIGGIIIVLTFMIFKEWRFIFFYFCFIPYVFCFFCSCFFVVETPLFLIKRFKVKQICQSLRFIAWVNGKEHEFDTNPVLSESHIAEMKNEYKEEMTVDKSVALTFLDLFRFSSLRMITVCSMLLFFSVNILYNAPQMLIDQIGFDFYLNGIIINCSELTTFFFTYFLITQVQRRLLNITTSTVSLVCSIVLIFAHSCTGETCSHSNGFEMVMIFIMRFAVSILNQIMYIYVAELFPVQVGGMALSIGCIFGHIPNAFLPELIHLMNKANFSVMIMFTGVSLLSMISSWIGPQTFGRQPQEFIEEIQPGEHRYQKDVLKQGFKPLPQNIVD